MNTASFEYMAKIEYPDTFEIDGSTFNNPKVITMTMKWKNGCGNLCGLFIDHERIVVIDQNLQIFVFGDVDVPVAVA